MILMGVCALGVAVFIYDKLTTNSPTVSHAQGQPQPQTSSPVAGGTAVPAADDSSVVPLEMPCQAVKERLQKAAGDATHDCADVPDVFCPSESWLPKVVQAPAPKAPEHDNGQAFLQTHKLQAVMLIGGSPKVIVNDKNLGIGQEIDGFKLIRVENRRAVFASVAGDSAPVELLQKTGIGQE